MKTFSTIAVAFLVFALAILSFGWRTEKPAFAATSDLPPTVIKGAQLIIVMHGAGALGFETFEVEEIRGTWVRVKTVKSEVWATGSELIWLNLGAIDQVAIAPPATTPAK